MAHHFLLNGIKVGNWTKIEEVYNLSNKKKACITVLWKTISHVPISNLVIEQLLVFNTNSSDMYIYIYIHIGSCLNTVTVDEG